MYGNLHYEKSYTTSKMLLTDNIHSGGNCSVKNNNSHTLKIEITQFPDGFRLNLLIKMKKLSSVYIFNLYIVMHFLLSI